mmetsp:Transcript_7193/g.18461  ORF Transcript_7193/g.18461 Transcript_7193/m.18461 type:complete len:223 (+) Transcript_7193:90-758(+)
MRLVRSSPSSPLGFLRFGPALLASTSGAAAAAAASSDSGSPTPSSSPTDPNTHVSLLRASLTLLHVPCDPGDSSIGVSWPGCIPRQNDSHECTRTVALTVRVMVSWECNSRSKRSLSRATPGRGYTDTKAADEPAHLISCRPAPGALVVTSAETSAVLSVSVSPVRKMVAPSSRMAWVSGLPCRFHRSTVPVPWSLPDATFASATKPRGPARRPVASTTYCG